MKRYFILLALVLFAINTYSTPVTIYPGLTLEENGGTYYVHFEMPKYEIVTDTFTVINSTALPPTMFGHSPGNYYFSRVEPVEDDYFDYLSENGRPELPFYSLNLLMPFDGGDYTIVNVNIISADTIKLPDPYTPSQSENHSFEDFSFDASYYVSYNTTWYWDECAADTIWYRNSKGLTLSVFPCHYEPSEQILVVVTEADYEIKYDGSYLTGSYLEYLLGMERSFYFFYDNYVGFTEPYPLINGDEYLIITADAWDNTVALSDFIHHKESLGYHVTKTPLHDIGYTSDEIRDYIRYEYETNNTKFVLLVGNVGDADSLAFSAGVNGDYHNPPTDIYYSCLSKNDISNQWKDYSPTVFVGRWPIQDGTQLRNIVDKTIASDLSLGAELANYSSTKISLFSGGDTNNANMRNYFYNDCKYIYKHVIQKYSYYAGTIFDGRSSSTNFYTMKNAMEIIDDPTWMFVYSGYGNDDVIGQPYDWYDFDIDNIVTSTLPFQPFGFGFSSFLGNIYSAKNFARAWLTSTEGGISFLGATTTSYASPDRYFSRKMFNQLKGRPNMTIGEFVCNAKAKYYNPDKVVWRRREAKKYVLYGDPSLYLFGLNLQYNQPNNMQERSQHDDEFTDDIISVDIYSMTGQLLRACDGAKPNLQGLPAGTYMVVYNSNNNSITQKLVLQ